ncbi:RING-type E3 ubiquitin transferase RNF13 [Hyphodiscus hymeniophilus]|uniref:RING-type E3 ubiquitin transferase RNF13 n=1 Tax=Hyphodiscus hymeniophilus TaxID=353542 RepID=A0A9P6VLL5_9HELO|nr:RING-type E3 ubiquitin transferase RNF13 [Hyphodiscus hymeniophilus]
MRPPRVVIVVAFFLTTVFLTFLSLRSSHRSHTITTTAPSSQNGLQSFFSFKVPFSLFPPNAIITLTHENSTAFLARPAAFGPRLPADGLKGQVWIGSGFGDDSMRQGAVGTSAEGELGCSDVPGWVESSTKSNGRTSESAKAEDGNKATSAATLQKRSDNEDGPFDRTAEPEETVRGEKDDPRPTIDDGTDDYLHHPLPDSTVSKPTAKDAADSNGNHADIQSLQEGAEIAGKVVLLSRGGCGFLEKVKWAQRRGGIAVIVGDDLKGGSLFQMYARGDTSNVTIPSVFTSRTTAHLLSSLVGSGGFIENSVDGHGNPTLKVQHTDKTKQAGKKQNSNPTFTPTTTVPKSTLAARVASKASTRKGSTLTESKAEAMTTQRPGWFKSLFFGSATGNSKSDSSRPPSSGQLDWILVDDWKDDDKNNNKVASIPKPDTIAETGKKPAQKNKGGDDFVIGVQDWRDPDLVGISGKDNEGKAQAAKAGGKMGSTKTRDSTPQPTKAGKKHIGGALQNIPEYIPPLRGGINTPGSGEYGEREGSFDKSPTKFPQEDATLPGEKSKGILNAIFGVDEEDADFPVSASNSNPKFADAQKAAGDVGDDDEYDGLWVTLTPTSGASPFLDTLLVLVISNTTTSLASTEVRRGKVAIPQITEFYKLVIDYPSSSTIFFVYYNSTSPAVKDYYRDTRTWRSDTKHEKNASVSSEWKKYMGKQVECVVCLEEYIDGVSRVMSLPCGHEFHVDCITPWLTTRRRTCPICKGDVVRSLARGSPSSPRYEPYHDDSEDDVQIQAVESVNNSSSSALPIPLSNGDEDEGDLEQGIASPTPTRPRRTDRTGSWRSMIVGSLGSTSRSPQPSHEHRNR